MTVQNFDHDRSAYDRPNQKWICGWAADGGGCRLGPDVRGRCRTTHECRPVRNGDRWMCTRPTIAGGRCEHGPLPDGTCCRAILKCQPVRSVRSKRGAVVSGSAVLTIGFLVVSISGPWRGAFLSPGQLSTTHAQLEDDCVRCHSAADAGLVGVLQASLRLPAARTESGNCLQCHSHSIGTSYGSPHSLPRHALDVLMEKASSRERPPPMPLRASLAATVAPNLGRSDDIACAVCHAEHRGRRFDLTRMDSMSCQSCHQQKFHSFSRGHPQFSAKYPTKRRTRIAFNHSSHLLEYFEAEGWADACLSCHQPDSNGARMMLGGFETTCGSCHHHRRQIAGGLSESSVPVFGLPAVDLETLDAHGLWIGDEPWPVDSAVEDFDLSPFMKLLLSSDEVIARDLGMLFDDPELLLDLSGAEDQVVEAVGRLLWAIKILIHDLLADDGAALAQRLTAAFGSEVTDAQLAALTGEPADISFGDHQTWRHNLRRLQEEWLGDLSDEVSKYRANPDLLYSGRLSLARAAESPSSEGAATPAQDEPTDDDLLGEDEGDDLLGDEDELLGGAGEEESGQEDDLFGDDDDLLGDSGHDEPDQPADELAQSEPSEAQVQLEALRLSLRESGGWFFDEVNFAVAYRPTGHADPFLRTWLDRTAAAGKTTAAAAGRAVFEKLRRDRAPGRCIKCHSVDTIGIGDAQQYRVNWNASRPTLGKRSFTKFVHRPHFKFQQFSDCTACHSIRAFDSAAVQAWSRTYAGADVSLYAASFGSMSLAQCAGCHTPSGVGDGCLTCHNYHVGSFEWTARLSFSITGGAPTP